VGNREAAEFFGVTPSTLRRWEREGKLVPDERTPGGYRAKIWPDCVRRSFTITPLTAKRSRKPVYPVMIRKTTWNDNGKC
jgi:hypothetical protein